MDSKQKLLHKALLLAWFTVIYNIIEGLVSVAFGVSDDSLSLLGFGVDSFVEVISGVGIVHMLYRSRKADIEKRDSFERQALRVTGTAFYLLTAGLVIGAVINVVGQHYPETTVVGVIVSVVSLLVMFFLYKVKLRTGRELKSDAIIADANCTKTCFYLSFILLGTSLLYEVLHIGWFDVLGSLGIAWFAFKEGKEAFEKARSEKMSCSCGDGCKGNQ